MQRQLRSAQGWSRLLAGSLFALSACSSDGGSGSGEERSAGARRGEPKAQLAPAIDATSHRVVEHGGKPLVVMSGAVTPGAPELPVTNGADILLLQLQPDGEVDASFGRGGLAAVDFGALAMGGSQDTPMAVAVAPDGKIAIAGRGATGTLGIGGTPALARLLPDGTLDPAFGQGGRVLFLPSGADRSSELAFRAVEFDEQGRLYVYGGEKFGPTWLLRFQPDGQHDPTFGTASKPIDPNIGNALGLVVTSARIITVSDDFGFAAYTHAGVLDETFGMKGYVDGGKGTSVITVRRADGAIVVGGVQYAEGSSSTMGSLKLMVLGESGAPDSAFGMGGTASVQVAEDAVELRGLSVMPDGRLYVAYSSLSALYLLRLTPAGALDPSFGEGGKTKLAPRVSLVDLSEINSNDLGLVGDTVWLSTNDTRKTPSVVVTTPLDR